MRSRIVFIAAAVAALMALAIPGEATHRWSKYHWKGTTSERTIPLIDNTSGWSSYVNEAVSDWNESLFIQLTNGGAGTANRQTCPAAEGKVRVCNYTYGNTGWLGVAQIWLYRGGDGHIAQGTVKMNDTYFNQSQYNTDAYKKFVTCQEIGHTFGLDHQDENQENDNLGSCMTFYFYV